MKVDIDIMITHIGNPIGQGTGHAEIKLHCVYKGEDRENTLEIDQDKVTQNEFALTACIRAMKELVFPCDVDIHINNQYIISSSAYVGIWESNGWKRKGNKQVKNLKLWQQLYMLLNIHRVKFSELEVEHEKHNAG